MLTQVNGRRVQASWTAPSNDVVDYRVFVNGANVNGNGNIVASGTTTYTPKVNLLLIQSLPFV